MRNADFRFSFPSAGTLFVTLRPKSHSTNLGISHLFLSCKVWDIPTFSSSITGTFFITSILAPSFLQTNNRDTSHDTSSTTQAKNQLRSEIILKPEPTFLELNFIIKLLAMGLLKKNRSIISANQFHLTERGIFHPWPYLSS